MAPTFFEGPEKKVELAVVDDHPSLRAFGAPFWHRVVAAAKADVLSTISNQHLDAYLLSESSLFVYDNFVTMITCGRTTLVRAVETMLEQIDRDAISVLVYERKNEHFPHDQPSSFFDDARWLRELVPGRAVRFGVEHEHAVRVFHSTREHTPESDDRTLEVLMHGIRPERAERFCSGDPSVKLASELGLDLALRGHEIDEHCFSPTGYSFNAIRGVGYTTLHVTPDRPGSYVSFETNVTDFHEHLSELVTEVVALFEPESFDVVSFEPRPTPIEVAVPGYTLRKRVREPLCGYHVTFEHFFRQDLRPTRAFEIDLG